MVKHIITTHCPFNHPYCITKNLKCEEQYDIFEVSVVYHSLFREHNSIMLTGGEPTSHPFFYGILGAANSVFTRVYLTTAVFGFITDPYVNLIDAITLSLHGDFTHIPRVTCRAAVYASIMADQYEQALPERLYTLGFSGLTICEITEQSFLRSKQSSLTCLILLIRLTGRVIV